MSILARTRMASDEFLAWAMQRPEGKRWELVGGELVGMLPERSGHALVKARVWRALDDAIKAMALGCTAYPDGMAVEIDDATLYEPDALVRCDAPLDDDAVKIIDPVIVVEVLSPSSQARDAGGLRPAALASALPARPYQDPRRRPPPDRRRSRHLHAHPPRGLARAGSAKHSPRACRPLRVTPERSGRGATLPRA